LNTDSVVKAIDHWIDALVIGQNLCPFAHAVRRRGLLRISVSQSDRIESILQLLADETLALVRADAQATTLLVVPEGLEDFDDYLDALALAEALLSDLGYAGELQIASFHPDYQFDGSEPSDAGNWTNRAPFPVFHLLKESSVTTAVDSHPDPDSIPEKNIAKLEALGIARILELLIEPASQ